MVKETKFPVFYKEIIPVKDDVFSPRGIETEDSVGRERYSLPYTNVTLVQEYPLIIVYSRIELNLMKTEKMRFNNFKEIFKNWRTDMAIKFCLRNLV